MNALWQWVGEYGLWLGVFSIVTFVASLALIPVLVARIPADYFVDRRRHLSRSRRLHPLLYLILIVLKNGLGILLLNILAFGLHSAGYFNPLIAIGETASSRSLTASTDPTRDAMASGASLGSMRA